MRAGETAASSVGAGPVRRGGIIPLALWLLTAAACAGIDARPAVPLGLPNWAGAGGGSGRCYADRTPVDLPLAPAWSHDAGRGVLSPPALGESLLFLGTADRRLVALSVSDGERVWVRAYRAGFTAGHAVAGRFLFANTDTPEGVLRCHSQESGDVYWERLTGPTTASPYAARDVILVATTGGTLLALDRRWGELRWEKELGGPVLSSPVVSRDVALVCTLGGELSAFRLSGGEELWRRQSSGGVEADLAVAGSTVLVGSASFGVEAWSLPAGDRLWRRRLPYGCVALAAEGDDVLALGPDGTLAALVLSSGESKWRRDLPGSYQGSLALASNAVLVGGMDGRLRVLSRSDGELRWEWRAAEPLIAPPVAIDGSVLLVGSRGAVTKLVRETDPQLTGGPAASSPEEREAPAGASAPVAEGTERTLYSCPFGTSVFRGDDLLGRTPLPVSLRDLTGDTLSLRHPGYLPLTLPVDSLAVVPPPLRFLLDREGKETPRSYEAGARLQARRARLAFGAALLAGGAAVYCKHRADSEFDRYRRTGRVASMRAHFRRAEKWDRFSLLAWGATQLAVAAGTYFLARHDEEANRPAHPERGWGRDRR